ncbi:MAG: MoaD/ThiS family protein [Gammaproteobacteria bacterium]|nr:MoaD/ThiS family protein [Gammaproteobacteria bacterium]
MKLKFKLYASLGEHLPSGTSGHEISIEVPKETTPLMLLKEHGVPLAEVHLVLINGIFIPVSQRDIPLNEGDELAVWPAVAGG